MERRAWQASRRALCHPFPKEMAAKAALYAAVEVQEYLVYDLVEVARDEH